MESKIIDEITNAAKALLRKLGGYSQAVATVAGEKFTFTTETGGHNEYSWYSLRCESPALASTISCTIDGLTDYDNFWDDPGSLSPGKNTEKQLQLLKRAMDAALNSEQQ